MGQRTQNKYLGLRQIRFTYKICEGVSRRALPRFITWRVLMIYQEVRCLIACIEILKSCIYHFLGNVASFVTFGQKLAPEERPPAAYLFAARPPHRVLLSLGRPLFGLTISPFIHSPVSENRNAFSEIFFAISLKVFPLCADNFSSLRR